MRNRQAKGTGLQADPSLIIYNPNQRSTTCANALATQPETSTTGILRLTVSQQALP
ncbi:MAG: hypothetical protein J6C86_10570 [Bacteroidaceae bacterium]|nr:hypothetical protein [Bacteroidaceae bacterium]